MSLKCSICKCSFNKKQVRFLKCPKSKVELWSAACGVPLNENSKVCMYHFNNSDYIELHQPSKRARLMPRALPSATPIKGLLSVSNSEGICGKFNYIKIYTVFLINYLLS